MVVLTPSLSIYPSDPLYQVFALRRTLQNVSDCFVSTSHPALGILVVGEIACRGSALASSIFAALAVVQHTCELCLHQGSFGFFDKEGRQHYPNKNAYLIVETLVLPLLHIGMCVMVRTLQLAGHDKCTIWQLAILGLWIDGVRACAFVYVRY